MNNCRINCLLALICCMFICSSVRAQESNPPQSLRERLAGKGIEAKAVFYGDYFSNIDGGFQKRSNGNGMLDLILNIDLKKSIRWPGASFSADAVWIRGTNPSESCGDFQGISNIAAFNTFRIYESWFQQNFRNDLLSFRAGIYDLNSEFDVIENAGIFLNGAFGMGPEYAQSGKNCAPTYPLPALAFRVKIRFSDQMSVKTVVMDGVPGELTDPEKLSFKIDQTEGFLLASEFTFIKNEKTEIPAVKKHRGKGKGWRKYGRQRFRCYFHRCGWRHKWRQMEISSTSFQKFSIGGWYYTSDFEDFQQLDTNGNPRLHYGNWGVYASAERTLFSASTSKTLSAFLRTGLANNRVNIADRHISGGLVFHTSSLKHLEDFLGLACSAVHTSNRYRNKMAAAGEITDHWEFAIELTYKMCYNRWISLQPDVQYIINPGFVKNIKNALAAGIRMEISL